MIPILSEGLSHSPVRNARAALESLKNEDARLNASAPPGGSSDLPMAGPNLCLASAELSHATLPHVRIIRVPSILAKAPPPASLVF